jgi:eukaryotic-like serine/threonine-protein kinase
VYRGRHLADGRLAAVKVLGPSPACDSTAARRLAREYEVLRALDHPNVVRVFDAGVAEGFSYLAMELIEGLDLRTWLSPELDEGEPAPLPRATGPASLTEPATPGGRGPEAIYALASMMDEPETEPAGTCLVSDGPDLPGAPPAPRPALDPASLAALNRPRRVARLRGVLRQVLDGLAYVHARGLVHRDLKPTNIMVDDRRRARLMDFGLVKGSRDDEALTQAGRVVGTYRYMSPEQAQGRKVDARSDLYSVGVILYELLCASPPFTARDPGALWREILHQRPPPVVSLNPGADPVLAALAVKLLEKDAAGRLQTAEAVIEALGA